MAQTGRSNVRYVDPQRRYTVVLGLSWNAPFGALPHDDRAGTHDSADGRCGSYASIGRGQAALWITSKIFVAVLQPLGIRHERHTTEQRDELAALHRADPKPKDHGSIAGQGRASQQKRTSHVRFGSEAACRHVDHVCFAPRSGHARPRLDTSALCQSRLNAPQQEQRYSITSSARSRIAVDGSMPIALAVFRFTTSSNFVGCSMGKSAGLAPRAIRSTNSATRPNSAVMLGP